MGRGRLGEIRMTGFRGRGRVEEIRMADIGKREVGGNKDDRYWEEGGWGK